VSKYFDKELNEVACDHLAATHLVSAVNNISSECTSDHCAVIGCRQIVDNGKLGSFCENKSSYNTSNDSQTDAHLCDVRRCHFEAERWRQPTQETSSVTSFAAEPKTDADILENDVSWFFEEKSDADVCHEQQTLDDVSRFLSSVSKLADVTPNRMVSSEKPHKTTPTVKTVPFQKGLDGCVMADLNALDIQAENDCSHSSAQPVSESLVADDSQKVSGHSELTCDNHAFVVSSTERCIQSIGNVEKAISSNQNPLETDRESDEKLTGTLLQAGLCTVPRQTKSVIPSLITDHKSVHERSPKSVSDSHRSRILLHSRHFRSVKNPTCDLTAGGDDLTDEITTYNMNMHDCDRHSSMSLSEQSQKSDINKAVADKTFAADGASYERQQTADYAVNSTSEKITAREPAYFDRLKIIGMCLSRADDELMQLAMEVCRQQLTHDPAQTWFVF